MQLVECIPNFSEGRNPAITEAIAHAIHAVPNVWLLHTDIGYDANRTVFTFAGDIRQVGEAAYQAILTARKLIDMRIHQGEHPRIGACDVCPFVPLGDTSIQDVINLTHDLGKKLGEKGIPVYMYEKSALHTERKNLAAIRKGEYESLSVRLLQEKWKPDYGPTCFDEKFGAMVLGARPFLIAYNVNLESKDVEAAQKIASVIREKNGGLSGVKAIGWWMKEYQKAQVSTNITDINRTGIKEVFDAVRAEAARYNIEVQTSELIGLIPESVILKAGKEISPKEQNPDTLIKSAFGYLGMTGIGAERILERRLRETMSR